MGRGRGGISLDLQEAKQSGGEASLPTGWTACQSGAVNLQEFLQALTRSRAAVCSSHRTDGPPSSPGTHEALLFPPSWKTPLCKLYLSPRFICAAATTPARGKGKKHLLGGRGTGLERGEAGDSGGSPAPPLPLCSPQASQLRPEAGGLGASQQARSDGCSAGAARGRGSQAGEGDRRARGFCPRILAGSCLGTLLHPPPPIHFGAWRGLRAPRRPLIVAKSGGTGIMWNVWILLACALIACVSGETVRMGSFDLFGGGGQGGGVASGARRVVPLLIPGAILLSPPPPSPAANPDGTLQCGQQMQRINTPPPSPGARAVRILTPGRSWLYFSSARGSPRQLQCFAESNEDCQ